MLFPDFIFGIFPLILDHMSILGYSTCRIQYEPSNGREPQNYSERSLIELRQVRDTQFAIRALDIENNKRVGRCLQ